MIGEREEKREKENKYHSIKSIKIGDLVRWIGRLSGDGEHEEIKKNHYALVVDIRKDDVEGRGTFYYVIWIGDRRDINRAPGKRYVFHSRNYRRRGELQRVKQLSNQNWYWEKV